MSCKAGSSPNARHEWEAVEVRGHQRQRCLLCGMLNMLHVPKEVRFWDYVDKGGPGGCWLWTGALFHGYGYYGWGGARAKRAHHISWVFSGRELPPSDMDLCHRCDVRNCVNPEHLFVGTRKDNIHDMIRKGRKKGAKLTPDQVRMIRAQYDSGKAVELLTALYNVSLTTIKRIVTRQGWKAVSLSL